MHREIGRGQVVTPFTKSGLARLEDEVVYSKHIRSGKILFVLATNEPLDLLQRSRSKPFKGALPKKLVSL